MSSKDKDSPLKYARALFCIDNLKEASRTAKAQRDPNEDPNAKNDYEVVLEYIADRLNQNYDFRKNATAEIYQYQKHAIPNIIHFKGLKKK